MTTAARFSILATLYLFTAFCFSPAKCQTQPLNFSQRRIKEPVDVKFWQRYPRQGIEIKSPLQNAIFHLPITFSNTTFDSTANFGFATFDSTADFSADTFHSTANFSETAFGSAEVFGNSTLRFSSGLSTGDIGSRANFTEATFGSTADFLGALFGSRADFLSATFRSTANFSGAAFASTADFLGATFDSTAVFRADTFYSTADFGEATLRADAYFGLAHFFKGVDFTDSRFYGSVDFSDATFNTDISFNHATFYEGSRVNFSGAHFYAKSDFADLVLPKELDFRDITDITHEIDFTNAFPPFDGGKCRIALEGSDVSKIKLNMKIFELDFFNPNTPTDQISQVYEKLLKKLKDDGFMESYQILDIDYRQFKYKHKRWYEFGWLVNEIQHRWWKYGYNGERVYFWSIGFWLGFSLINLIFYPKLSENIYEIPFLGKLRDNVVRGRKKWRLYFLQVAAYTAIIFFGLKMDLEKFKDGAVKSHPWLFTYLMTIYTIGIVCLGFIVNQIFKS